jgi:DNA topoisomerase-6 subunit B
MAAGRANVAGQLNFSFKAVVDEGGMKNSGRTKPTRKKSKRAGRKSAAKSKTAKKSKAASRKNRKSRAAAQPGPATAESMAAQQRDISVSEFFAKNRHLLGFDNPRKALLTAVKEGVDNSLDACEEAHILPDVTINIEAISENKFKLAVTDNGPGIIKQQVPHIFARLLYGSKFHRLKMSRGQQGIGISAAGMYGLITTGEPVQIISRTDPKAKAHHYHVQIETTKNRPEVVLDEECDFDRPTGTKVTIMLEGRYQKGRQSIDEYVAQTAMANPHATIIYNGPDGEVCEYKRQTKELPFVPREIKPHPYGVELGLLYKMLRATACKHLSAFLRNEFSRVSAPLARRICDKAGLSIKTRPGRLYLKQAEILYKVINQTKIMAPSSDCIGPIGAEQLEAGLKRVVGAEFYASCSRGPSVYRGNPFLVEAALAYGRKEGEKGGNGVPEPDSLIKLIRIANRVPLLYQQSGCAIYKSVLETNWRNYALTQSRGALPTGPMVLMVHIASVWVPFTSESKEAIAHYPEIIKEIKLAAQECGRKLGLFLRKKKRIQQELIKRSYIEAYLPYIGEALQEILALKQAEVSTVVNRLKVVLEKSRQV